MGYPHSSCHDTSKVHAFQGVIFLVEVIAGVFVFYAVEEQNAVYMIPQVLATVNILFFELLIRIVDNACVCYSSRIAYQVSHLRKANWRMYGETNGTSTSEIIEWDTFHSKLG